MPIVIGLRAARAQAFPPENPKSGVAELPAESPAPPCAALRLLPPPPKLHHRLPPPPPPPPAPPLAPPPPPLPPPAPAPAPPAVLNTASGASLNTGSITTPGRPTDGDAPGACGAGAPAPANTSSSSPGGGGGAVMRVIRMPMPSMPARSTPPNAAERPALASPCRSCAHASAEVAERREERRGEHNE